MRTISNILAVLACSFPVTSGMAQSWSERGIASWYGPGFAGRPTASGEIYDPSALTAAHKELELGSLVRVYNLENGRSMIVRINDRGPFVSGRIIDLSRASAEVLGFKDAGLARVRIELLNNDDSPMALMSETVRNVVDSAVDRFVGAESEEPVAINPPEPKFKIEDLPPDTGSATQVAAAETQATSTSTPPAGQPRPLAEPPESPRLQEGYFIQVGAFSKLGNADERADLLEHLNLEAHVERYGGMFRVLAGPFASVSQADAALHRLSSAGVKGFLRTSRR